MLRVSLLVGMGLLLTASPMASAFHGGSYHATGQAIGPDGTVYNAVVDWCGYDARLGCPYDNFHVVLTDAVTGAPVADSMFRGAEQFGYIPTYGGNELLSYHGYSVDSAVSFDVKGLVYNKLTSPPASHMLYVGNYEAYQLLLTVDQQR